MPHLSDFETAFLYFGEIVFANSSHKKEKNI